MASRRNRNSTQYLGTITKTQLDQAATTYQPPDQPLSPAQQADLDDFAVRVLAREAKMARLGFTHRRQLTEYEAQMERKDRQLAAEAKITGRTFWNCS